MKKNNHNIMSGQNCEEDMRLETLDSIICCVEASQILFISFKNFIKCATNH